MIEEKKKEFSGLISSEGAAYLIANELGLELLEKTKRKLEIGNIVPGMRNVSFVGRIFNISPIIEFERGERKGRVVNLFVGDKTGFVRIPLWNEQVRIVEEDMIGIGDCVRIVNGMSKDGLYGIEITLGRYGRLEREDREDIPTAEELRDRFLGVKKVKIKDVRVGRYTVTGTVVHVFGGAFFFEVCPKCGGKVNDGRCEVHGEVKPRKEPVVTIVVDDGTGNLRAVLFRENVRKLIGNVCDDESFYESVRKEVLGKEVELTGRVRKNKISGELELVVSDVKNLNVAEKSKKLAKELGLYGKEENRA